MRFVVTAIEGFLTPSGSGEQGLSCMVLDTLFNKAVLEVWRTEDMPGYYTLATKKRLCRERATRHAQMLNAGITPPKQRQHGFRPTCPRCKHLCDSGSVVCVECGARLGLTV